MNTCADEVPGGIFLNNYIEGVLSVEDRTDYFNSSLIGQKDDRRRVQCSLDCITHTSCVAVSWMAHMEEDEPLKEGVCFLFRQVALIRTGGVLYRLVHSLGISAETQ